MSEKSQNRDGVPADYPGRIVGFPDSVTHLALALIGVQSDNRQTAESFISEALRHCDGTDGPTHIERGESVDAAGVPTHVLIAYWTDHLAAKAWWENAATAMWWQSLSTHGDAGYFCERMTIPRQRFNYAAGTEDRHGSAAALPLVGSSTFGYWGAYRDRLPASKTDDFKSPLAQVPKAAETQTLGRRLRVATPDNLCYIREGQGWGNCEAQERKIWDEEMNPVIDQWVARLGADASATGCLMIRDCREQDRDDGGEQDRRTQLSFLLSLSHIEQAARTDPAHLAVHGAFVRMYTEPAFTPRMHVWVEVGVLKAGELETEYVNCHPQTGLLPFFDANEVDA